MSKKVGCEIKMWFYGNLIITENFVNNKQTILCRIFSILTISFILCYSYVFFLYMYE